MQLISPTPYDDAINKFGDKSVVTSILNSEEWANVPVGLRDRAFFSATVENSQFLQRSNDFIDNFLSSARDSAGHLLAGGRSQFVKELQEFALSEGMGPLDPALAGSIQDITSEGRLGLIYDINTQSAHDFGYWKQGQDPDVLDEFPAQRFLRVQEVKVPRPYHQLNDGRVALKSDLDFWLSMNQDFGVPWGPWGYNSGMGVEDVDREEAEQSGLLKPGEAVHPIEAEFNQRLQASTANLSPELINALEDAFGDQVEIADGTARWTGPGASPAAAPAPEPPVVIAPNLLGDAIDANTSPVSDSLSISRLFSAESKSEIQSAIDAIDAIHDDGTLPDLTIKVLRSGDPANGMYISNRDGTSEEIQIKNYLKAQRVTAIHEIGHFLDHQALDAPGVFASIDSPLLSDFRAAVQASSSVSGLKTRLAKAVDSRVIKNYKYLLDPRELFARAYSQYITSASADVELQTQFDYTVDRWAPGAFWSDEDFAPIKGALDAAFKKKGWL